MLILRRIPLSISFACFAFFLAGCSLGNFGAPSEASSSMPAISGRVHGGQQPVTGSTIQLYAANSSLLKGASTALLTTPVTTDSGGNFSITGEELHLSHPYDARLHQVATGGNPGISGNVNNTGLALMAALGTCGTLTSSTFININLSLRPWPVFFRLLRSWRTSPTSVLMLPTRWVLRLPSEERLRWSIFLRGS